MNFFRISLKALLFCLLAAAFSFGQTVTRQGDGQVFSGANAIQDAIDDAGTVQGETLQLSAGTFNLTTKITVNKSNLTIEGAGNTVTFITGDNTITGSYFFYITAQGVTLQNLDIEKTDKAGPQNIVYVGANDVTIKNNIIHGHYAYNDGDVSRAMEVAVSTTGLLVDNNSIYSLRQPAYLNPGVTGTVSGNNIKSTKGWVVDNADITFTNNTWGSGNEANYWDIAILAGTDASLYPDLVSLGNDNNSAVIEDQRTSPRSHNIVFVNEGATGDGSPLNPFGTINSSLSSVVEGGTVNVAAGTYNEQVTLSKALTLNGANAGVHPAVGMHPTAAEGTRGSETILSHNFPAISPKADNITVNGFKFTGAGGRIVDTYADANNFHLTNCIFDDQSTANSQGVLQFGGGSHINMLIDYNLFMDKGDHTLYFGGGPYDGLTIEYNKFNVEGDGIFWAASALTGGVFSYNEIDGTIGGNPGVGFGTINIGQAGDLSIDNNYFHDLAYTPLQVGLNGGSITNNTFERIYPYATYGGSAFQLWGGEWGTFVSTDVNISGNTINYNDVSGAASSPVSGIRLRKLDGSGGIDGSTIHINHNNFINGGVRSDAYAIIHEGDQNTNVDARENYWGTTDASVIGSDLNNAANIDYTPWWGANYMNDNHAGSWDWYTDDNIQEAVNAASAGDVVYASGGTYAENISVGKDLTVRGISNPVVEPAAGDAFTVTAGTVNLLDLGIQNAVNGIKITGGLATISGCDIKTNEVGILITGGSLTAHINNIAGNTTYGINNLTNTDADARNNWWGDDSGPTYVSNTGGTGDVISDRVLYDPWLGAAGGNTSKTEITGSTGAGGKVISDQSNSGMDAVIVTVGQAGESATLYLSKYSAGENPGSSFNSGLSNYFDVFLDDPNNITESLVVKFYFSGVSDPGSSPIKWYDGTNWISCSNQNVVSTGAGEGYVEVTFNSSTLPRLDQLTALAFGFGVPALPTINIPDVNGEYLSEVEVPVNITLSSAGGFKGYKGTINYDASYFSYKSFDKTGCLFNSDNFQMVVDNSTPGALHFAAAGANATAGDGTLFKLTFEIISPDTGSPQKIAPSDFTGSQPVQNTFNYSAGTVSWTNPANTSKLRGDANQDFVVNFDDAIAVNGHLNGHLLTGQALLNADANEDNSITVEDIYYIITYATTGEWPAAPASPQGTLAISKAGYENNTQVVLPVQLKNASNIATCDVIFKYDPEKINYQSFASSLMESGYFVNASEIEPGKARFTVASSKLIEGNLETGKIMLKFSDGKIPVGSSVTTEYSLNNSPYKTGPSITFSLTGINSKNDNVIPDKFSVSQNYPNPFNPSTTIVYAIPQASRVTVSIYNMLGQKVKTLINSEKSAGTYSVQWNGDNDSGQKVTSGTYIYRVQAGEKVQTMKMILMK